ncbi:UNVERIFIED_CONTAM: hypothetical protein RMT77_012437 [Armadillidium vulgare]
MKSLNILILLVLKAKSWIVDNSISEDKGYEPLPLEDLSTPFAASNPHLSFMKPEAQNNSEVVAQLGGKATLSCYTLFLGDHLVIWLKRDEERLLTAGKQVYSSEGRYSISHVRHQKLWELTVREVKESDEGLYECQLTSHPPVSLFFWLKIIEARAVIRGRKLLHIKEGSRLQLYCHVEDATETVFFVFWFHNGSMINYKSRSSYTITKHKLGSTLVLSNVSKSDSGVYRCEPYLARPDNVTLLVTDKIRDSAFEIFRSSTSSERKIESHIVLVLSILWFPLPCFL